MTAIYDVYGVGRGAMCGGEEEGVRPASPLSRRHSRDLFTTLIDFFCIKRRSENEYRYFAQSIDSS